MTEKNTAVPTMEQALPIRPMNSVDGPMRYPIAPPSSLSADAQLIYADGRRQKLDRDLFDPKRRNAFIRPDEARAFRPTDRMLAGIAELETARLATYDTRIGHTLHCTPVHEHYTFARGRGSQLIKVSVFDEHPEDARLLAVLIGGDLESRDIDGGVHRVAVRSRHEDATDVEHDASSTALLVLRNLSQPIFTGYGRMTFNGVLTEANLYPIGVDPLTADDGRSMVGDTCTDCTTPHPFAPYLPPGVDDLSGAHFVTVETWPLRPYRVSAPPAFDNVRQNTETPSKE